MAARFNHDFPILHLCDSLDCCPLPPPRAQYGPHTNAWSHIAAQMDGRLEEHIQARQDRIFLH
jgi:hypothetical protein